ncbi:NAD(P)/FAD-dependent oxidoreductase [Streptomyces sp. 8N706]|uniref:NAD(P)/FAD-dependent oxidoreductase n=1 Tax=Streptomyces sp. 8N706 TaxID=3457416 RepID=UPI003FD54F2B
MARTADVAVIGDGVVGASIAYHLAAAGVSVALLSRAGAFERSATGNSAGQVRMHHSDPHDARLAALSMETFEHWPDLIGGDCGFRRTGFAFLVDEEHAGLLPGAVAELTGLGVETTVLTPDEFAPLHKALDLDGVGAVAYEPRSGYADPALTTASLVERARARGAVVVTGRADAELCGTDDRITGAVMDGETVLADHTVVAAGTGSAALCARAGVLPAAGDGTGSPGAAGLPLRTQQVGWAVADSSTIPGADGLCMVIDDTAGTYFRPDGPGRLLFRVPLDGRQGADHAPVRPEEIAAGRRLAAPRLQGIMTAPVTAAALACEAYTPDGRALIGPTARHPGLYLATGFNGGGFKTAPAVGRAVAAELASGAEQPELVPYRPGRFAAGEPRPISRRYRHM